MASCEVFICISLISNIFSLMYRANATFIKFPIRFFREIENNLKIHKDQRRWTIKELLLVSPSLTSGDDTELQQKINMVLA